MAIDFKEKEKEQAILKLIFIFVIIIIIFIFWQEFLKRGGLISFKEVPSVKSQKIEIKFETLERAKKLEPFISIERFKGKIGRDIPFLPY
jgi:hypothetical protein